MSAAELWAWHERPGAFERLAPPWEAVELLERSGGLGDGARTVLRTRIGPVPVRWVAEHCDTIPGTRFVDEQRTGPFAYWRHEHRMEALDARRAVLHDRIRYVPPFGPLGALVEPFAIRPAVERMLAYRHALTRDDLMAHAAAALPPLTIAVTGASGLVGSALAPFLTTGGHAVRRIGRRAAVPGDIAWDPARGQLDPAALEGVDAVVHLAGENVGAGRWTAARKAAIRDSRLQGTALLARTLAQLTRKPRVLVSASAVGIYGDRGDEILTEASAPAGGFLGDVARGWEDATRAAEEAGIRVVHLRFGVILSPRGGALAKLLPVFRLGLGGPIGSGRMWMPWLALDDAVGIIHWAIATEAARGAYNAVAPQPATNAEFTRVLGRVLGRPAVLPVPTVVLELLFGEMARGTILASTHAVPERLQREGYRFRQPHLEGALRGMLGRA